MAKMGTLTVRLDELYDDARQDLLDGAALRRLREALDVGWDVFPDGDRWCVYGGEAMADRDFASIWFYGDTIAEAVEKCLEALE